VEWLGLLVVLAGAVAVVLGWAVVQVLIVGNEQRASANAGVAREESSAWLIVGADEGCDLALTTYWARPPGEPIDAAPALGRRLNQPTVVMTAEPMASGGDPARQANRHR
jgi:hypothetical protein